MKWNKLLLAPCGHLIIRAQLHRWGKIFIFHIRVVPRPNLFNWCLYLFCRSSLDLLSLVSANQPLFGLARVGRRLQIEFFINSDDYVLWSSFRYSRVKMCCFWKKKSSLNHLFYFICRPCFVFPLNQGRCLHHFSQITDTVALPKPSVLVT